MTQVFIDPEVIKNATLSPDELERVKQRECTKCGATLLQSWPINNLHSYVCLGCGTMFILQGPIT